MLCVVVATLPGTLPPAYAAVDVPPAEDSPAGSKRRVGKGNVPGAEGLKEWLRKKRTTSRSGLDEKIVVHTGSKNIRTLIGFLTPPAWDVRFDVSAASLDRTVVFHAETTRRRALAELLRSLGLEGIFYPRRRLVLVVDGVRQ